VDALRPLMLDGTIRSNVVVGNAPVIGSMISARRQWTEDAAPISDAVIARMMEGLHLGFWNVRFALYGRKEIVAVQMAVVRSAVAGIEGAVFEHRSYEGAADAATVHPADHAQMGIPGIANVRMAEWRGGEAAHTDISLVCQPTGHDALLYTRMIRRNVERHGFDYTGGITLFPRHAIALAVVSFDKSSAEDRAAVSVLFPEVIEEASATGAAPYRSHLAFMDLIAAQYDAHHHAMHRLSEKIKDCLDPQGIFSPGKQGIWGSARSA
jgi:4-cresol dehydrogenase (hydroxylating)